MILVVVFSFNRAMQLDFLLKSILARFKTPDYKISVIYHTTGEHAEGYKKIRNMYKYYNNITFLERKPQIIGLKGYFYTLYSKQNILRFIKRTLFFNGKTDNFKYLLENLLKTTHSEFIMFNTDDSFFYEDVNISTNIFDLIRSNPLQTSYRLYVGENLHEFPDYVSKVDNDYYSWDYYHQTKITHWTYPFAVDGTVYHTKSILGIIKKVFYQNPTTLESSVVDYVKASKLLKTGLGPITSKLLCTKLNRVATNSLNPSIQISPEFLNEKFLDGFELDLDLPIEIINVNVVPLNVFISKLGIKQNIYSFNEEGKCIQESLGIEGTKPHKLHIT